MDPIRVRSNDIMKPTHCLSQSFHISHIFYIFSHALHCDRFQPWQSWQPHLAKATEKGCGNMWNVKTMWKRWEVLGWRFPGFFAFFFSRQLCISHCFSTPRTLQGLSKDSPKPKLCMLCSSVPCLQVPRHAPGQAYQTTQGVRWMDSAKESKRINKTQKVRCESDLIPGQHSSMIFDASCIVCTHQKRQLEYWATSRISVRARRPHEETWLVWRPAPGSSMLIRGYRGYTWHKHDLNPFQTLEDASFQM